MPGTNKLAKNAFAFTIGGLLSKVILFIFVPLFTFYLTTGESGTIDILTNVSDLAMIFLTLGMSEAVFRMVMEKGANKKAVYSIGLIMSLVGSLFLLLFVPLLDKIPVIAGFGLLLVAMTFTSQVKETSRTFVRGLEKVGAHIIGDTMNTFVFAILSIVFIIVLKWGIIGYLSAYVLGNVAEIIFLFIFCHLSRYITFKFKEPKLFWRMSILALTTIIPSVSWWMINMTNKILVTSYIDVSMSGIYSYAVKLPVFLAVLFNYFVLSWMISAVSDYENKTVTDSYHHIYQFVVGLFLTLTSLLITLIEPFTRFFMNASYYESWQYVPIMAITLTIWSFSIFFYVIYLSVKKPLGASISAFIGILINLGLGLLLIKPYGIYGIAIASFVSVTITYLYRYFDTRKYVLIRAGWKSYATFAIVLTQAILCFFLKNNTWILLFINIGLSLVIIVMVVPSFLQQLKNLRHPIVND